MRVGSVAIVLIYHKVCVNTDSVINFGADTNVVWIIFFKYQRTAFEFLHADLFGSPFSFYVWAFRFIVLGKEIDIS